MVATWTALASRVPTREAVRARSIHLEVGQTIDRDALVQTLVAAGYSRMALVEEPGELAVRGGILDLFPPQRENPLRVELLGDEVESIREFDAASQRSQVSLAYAVAPPPRELLLDRSLIIERSADLRELAASQNVEPRSVDALVDSLLRGNPPPGAEALAPLLQPGLETVLDFLPADTLIIIDDPDTGRDRLERYAVEAIDGFELAVASGRLVSPPDELLVPADQLVAEVHGRRPVRLERLDVAPASAGLQHISVRAFGLDELRRALVKARSSDRALAPLVTLLEEWCRDRWRVVLSAASLSGAERLRTLLSEYAIEARTAQESRPSWRWSGPGHVEVRVAPLSEGFVFPLEKLAVVTEEEIFGPREKRRSRAGWPKGAEVEALTQLSTGDHLVHVEHGIGVYRGLVSLTLRGIESEFLRLEYAEAARLFVPVHRLNLIQRYAGSDGHPPRIDKLGGASWEKAKNSVRGSLRDLARELLSLHAAREIAPGVAFSPRDRLMEEFESHISFRGDSRPVGCHRGRARRSAAAQTHGPSRLWRRGLRKDRGCHPRRLPRGDGRQAGCGARAHHDPVPAARGDIPTAFRGLSGGSRIALAISQRERSALGSRRIGRRSRRHRHRNPPIAPEERGLPRPGPLGGR